MIQSRHSNSVTNEQLQLIQQAIFNRYDINRNGYLDE